MMKKKAQKEEKDDESSVDKTEKVRGRELFWILGVMVGLIAIFLAGSFIFSELNKFDFGGLAFSKQRFGEIPVYHHAYYYNHPLTGNVIKYNFYLRNDPRENDVPVEGEGNIEFPPGKFAYISVDGHGLEQCEYSTLAIAGLSAFLTNNGIEVKGATPRFIEAERKNLEFATCSSKPERVVIEISNGEETKVVKESNMCHKIIISNCEVLEAVEKFEIQTILEARERARKSF